MFEIHGMTYKRLPVDVEGEQVTSFTTRCGNYITAHVYANAELIAFDQIRQPEDGNKADASYYKRMQMANKAKEYWQKQGFVSVNEYDTVGFKRFKQMELERMKKIPHNV